MKGPTHEEQGTTFSVRSLRKPLQGRGHLGQPWFSCSQGDQPRMTVVGSGVRALLVPSLCSLCLHLQDSSGACLRGLLEGFDEITYLKHLAQHLARKSHYYRTLLCKYLLG